MKMTPFEIEVLDSILWQVQGFQSGKISKRVTKRILRATLRRIKPKLIGISKMAHKSEKNDIDHAVPLKYLVQKIINEKELNKKTLLTLIDKYLISVEITQEEHRETLKDMGLSSKMPDDWDGVDPFARYKKSNIEVYENGI